MMRPFLALALAASTALPAAARAAEPSRASVPSPLASLFSDDDYPLEAMRKGEQGVVAFELSVGADGSVTACKIISSSGSSLLDSTTCRLMRERARFTPARDSAGKPTADTVASRIAWRLPEGESGSADIPPQAQTALRLWSACVGGEAAKRVQSPLPAAEVADRAIAACADLETLATRLLTKALPKLDNGTAFRAFKAKLLAEMPGSVETARAALKGVEE